MWQILALTSLLFSTTENVIDKIVVVTSSKMDTLLASFYRNFLFFILTGLVALTGIFGRLTFFYSWPIVIFAALSLGSGIFYTYLLKNIELTGAAALGYATPFLFLLVDVFAIKSPITMNQIAGVLLLVSGGLLFTINTKTWRIKPEYTKYIWAIFIYNIILYGTEYYTFKYYHAIKGLNEVSYLTSTWLLVSIGFIVLIILTGKWRGLRTQAVSNNFLAKETLSKSMDVFAAVLWLRALTLTEVSRVNALASFEPLMLIVLLYIFQQRFKFKAGENFDGNSLVQKVFATAVLILGAWLAS